VKTPIHVRTDEEFKHCQNLNIVVYVIDADNGVKGKGLISAFDHEFVKIGEITFDRDSYEFTTLVDDLEKEDALDL
jgi:hypothetical protein